MSFTLDNPNYGDIYKDWMYLGFNPVIKICAVYKDHGLLEDDMYTFSFDLGDFNRDSKMWDSGILTITQEKPCVEGTYKIQNHGTNDRFRLNSVERWSAKEIYRFNALSNTNAVRQGEPNGRQGERNARPSSSE
ncbi:hypothetical protein [Fangia hongkongensis]|uniref:hypothetical protein n=1 Tax=Fangia hongkongensis TaxID=270495 RepID=UPI0012B59CA2|nr:hypothetical protein [Fangia hongkongensis]MBK2124926.1 hypothetical protein [Fangia hongkongensis]